MYSSKLCCKRILSGSPPTSHPCCKRSWEILLYGAMLYVYTETTTAIACTERILLVSTNKQEGKADLLSATHRIFIIKCVYVYTCHFFFPDARLSTRHPQLLYTCQRINKPRTLFLVYILLFTRQNCREGRRETKYPVE